MEVIAYRGGPEHKCPECRKKCTCMCRPSQHCDHRCATIAKAKGGA